MAAPEEPKITLYWLEKSRSQRIMWLLEECKVKYEVQTYHRQKSLAPPELKKIHPLGKSPVISVQVPGEDKPRVIAESGFITEYLTDHFAPHLKPERWQPGKEDKLGGETETWMRYRYFMHYAEGTLMPFLVLALICDGIRNTSLPFFIKFITNKVAERLEGFIVPNVENNFKFLEENLATTPEGGKYLCGPKLTGADILLSFPLIAAKGRTKIDAKKYPKLVAYTDMIEKEPGYIAAVAKIEKIDGRKYEPAARADEKIGE